MDELMEQGIKSIIDRYPAVGDLLNEYEVGCVPCQVGTCLLKDIVEIHNLSPDEEYKMMVRMAEIVMPGQEVTITRRERKVDPTGGGPKYSPPMKQLVEEHKLIKRFLALVPPVIGQMDLETEEGRKRILDGVNFVRRYADAFHHAKEEDILFRHFDRTLEILQVMYADHDTARNHMKAIVEAVEKRDRATVAEHLEAYRTLLTDHITREDNVLYPWMDRNLSDHQVGGLFAEFGEVDQRFGGEPSECEAFVRELEEDLT